VTDEWTREGLAIEVEGRIRSGRVLWMQQSICEVGRGCPAGESTLGPCRTKLLTEKPSCEAPGPALAPPEPNSCCSALSQEQACVGATRGRPVRSSALSPARLSTPPDLLWGFGRGRRGAIGPLWHNWAGA
jgi:hypothetical protein